MRKPRLNESYKVTAKEGGGGGGGGERERERKRERERERDLMLKDSSVRSFWICLNS